MKINEGDRVVITHGKYKGLTGFAGGRDGHSNRVELDDRPGVHRVATRCLERYTDPPTASERLSRLELALDKQRGLRTQLAAAEVEELEARLDVAKAELALLVKTAAADRDAGAGK